MSPKYQSDRLNKSEIYFIFPIGTSRQTTEEKYIRETVTYYKNSFKPSQQKINKAHLFKIFYRNAKDFELPTQF